MCLSTKQVKQIVVLGLLILPILPAGAGQPDVLADNLQKTYQQVADWKTDFVQTTHVELLDRTVRKGGTLSIKKPGRIRIEYDNNAGKLYLSNGKKLWVYSRGDSQVVVYKNFSKILASEALSFLQGLGDIRRQFRVSSVPPKTPDIMMQDSSLNLLVLEPLSPESLLERIILGIDSQTQVVKEATLFNASGNRTHYLFQNIELNSNLSDGLFQFVTPKGVREVKG